MALRLSHLAFQRPPPPPLDAPLGRTLVPASRDLQNHVSSRQSRPAQLEAARDPPVLGAR